MIGLNTKFANLSIGIRGLAVREDGIRGKSVSRTADHQGIRIRASLSKGIKIPELRKVMEGPILGEDR